MSAADRNTEEISSGLRRTGPEDSLYVLDLSRRQSRTREKEVCELEQMIESSQVDSLRKQNSDSHPLFSATARDPQVGNIETNGLGFISKGNKQCGKMYPDSFSFTEEDQVLTTLEVTPLNQVHIRQDQGSLFSLKAKTELKVLSKHVYQTFLVSNSASMPKVRVTEELAKKILPTDIDISDVRPSYPDVLLSKTSERSIQGP